MNENWQQGAISFQIFDKSNENGNMYLHTYVHKKIENMFVEIVLQSTIVNSNKTEEREQRETLKHDLA